MEELSPGYNSTSVATGNVMIVIVYNTPGLLRISVVASLHLNHAVTCNANTQALARPMSNVIIARVVVVPE